MASSMKLFISYRSLDSDRVDMLVNRLKSLRDSAGHLLYEIWQVKDPACIPPGKDWWEAIVEGLTKCDVVVFMVSHESVKNVNCAVELSYAFKRNRPIIAFVLDGEFKYNPDKGKHDLEHNSVGYWDN